MVSAVHRVSDMEQGQGSLHGRWVGDMFLEGRLGCDWLGQRAHKS
jgi:hypothetical protein